VALFLISQFERSQGYAVDALRGFEALGAEYSTDAQKVSRFLERFNPIQ